MRTNLTHFPADHVVLVGSSAAAMTALWRLCAAGARVRWYADSADVGEEAFLAHALGHGRVELSFDDPLTASLDGATAIVLASAARAGSRLADRARKDGVPVLFAGEAESQDQAVTALVRT